MVEFTVVVVPLTVKLPVTVKLSPTVTSDVVWPTVTGTPETPAPIFIPPVVSLVSIVTSSLASISIVVPFISSAPDVVNPTIVPKLVMFGCAAVPNTPITVPELL